MKARCPNSDDHKKFETVATVLQAWEVDEEGRFLDELDPAIEVVHPPDKQNTWTCRECGAEAILED
jgi:hypothetical protein